MNELTADLNAAIKRETRLRKRRDDAARTLTASGYTSKELAAPTSVQASRVRQYVTEGEYDDEYQSVQDFVKAFENWQKANARMNRLKYLRNQAVIDRVAAGARQVDVAADFSISQFLVSHIVNSKQAGSLL